MHQALTFLKFKHICVTMRWLGNTTWFPKWESPKRSGSQGWVVGHTHCHPGDQSLYPVSLSSISHQSFPKPNQVVFKAKVNQRVVFNHLLERLCGGKALRGLVHRMQTLKVTLCIWMTCRGACYKSLVSDWQPKMRTCWHMERKNDYKNTKCISVWNTIYMYCIAKCNL